MPSDPFKELTSLLDNRMKNQAAQAVSGTPSELGVVTSTGLKLDSFKHEIRDYLVADWLVKLHFPARSIIVTSTSPVDAQGNELPGAVTSPFLTRYNIDEIDQVRLELKVGLKPGDRVLAVPVNGGQDAVIICKVVS
ncbi:MAG: hypothetical protein HPY50_04920 [Firmicutes bacterium]|nr:hypothetical protein [Bacillota bacterium]